MIFAKFAELTTVRQTLLWFLEHGLELPARRPNGEVIWKRPSYATVYRILTNPAYGGTYAYGKTGGATVYGPTAARHGLRRKPRGEWLALCPGTHEGYVAWEQAEAIRHMITDNRQGEEHRGAVKHGDALLAGMLRCRRCGRKLTLRYTGSRHQIPRYSCSRGWMDNGEPRCIAFGGLRVDDAIAAAVLRVVEPAAIQAALQAQRQEAQQRD